MTAIDPLGLAQALIRCPSVTPADAGALDVVEAALSQLGFSCQRLRFAAEAGAPVDNLYARKGGQGPNFCFAGHTDVVPPGDLALWRSDPFAAEIRDGILFGRGAVDMKSAIAAFIAAASREAPADGKGSISLLITGDEEGPGINGTKAVLEWLKQKGERLDHCIVGEPTSAATTGDTVKIGRRGSMNVRFVARGIQGHTAYPQKALNPIPILAELVTRLTQQPLDCGTAHFEPSTLVFSTFDVGNPATNVSPAEARAVCNIRFNDLHTPQSLDRLIERTAEDVVSRMGGEIAVETTTSGPAFVTEPGAFVTLVCNAITSVTGKQPALSTGGGTSDARFIKDACPVAEVGLPGSTMHMTNECVAVGEIARLTDIYAALLRSYFARPPA